MEGHGLEVGARKGTNAGAGSKSPPLHRLIQSTPQNGRAQPNLQLLVLQPSLVSTYVSCHCTNPYISFCKLNISAWNLNLGFAPDTVLRMRLLQLQGFRSQLDRFNRRKADFQQTNLKCHDVQMYKFLSSG